MTRLWQLLCDLQSNKESFAMQYCTRSGIFVGVLSAAVSLLQQEPIPEPKHTSCEESFSVQCFLSLYVHVAKWSPCLTTGGSEVVFSDFFGVRICAPAYLKEISCHNLTFLRSYGKYNNLTEATHPIEFRVLCCTVDECMHRIAPDFF